MDDPRVFATDQPVHPRKGPLACRFQQRFEAGDLATRAVLQDLVAFLADAGIGDDDLVNVELILAEALNNVSEHAYAGGTGPVEVVVEVQRTGLFCRIADRGKGIPSGQAPDPDLPTINPPSDLPEGGFGWHIIRCLTRDLTYGREAGWNRLSMYVPWSDLD
ncbi:MAG: ATP-binding protein [Pararhodobacter sp.]